MAAEHSTRRSKPKKRKLRYGRVLLLLTALILIPLLIWGTVEYMNPLKLKGDVYTTQLGEAFDPKGNIQSVFFDDADNVQFEGTVNTSEPSESDVAYIYKGKRYPFTVKTADVLPPDLTLKDVTTDTTQSVVAEDFIDTISDVSGYTLRLDSDDDLSQPGEHTIRVTARDSYDNTVTKTAKLRRIEDKEAPVLEDFKDSSIMRQGGTYQQQEYDIKDNIDTQPILHVDTSQLNTETPGSYPVSYVVRDRSGNENVYTQTVEVQENPDYGKQVCYLTFDDGPSANTLKILDILKQNDVDATFFVTGANPEYYGVMKQIVDDGNTIALHTFSHNYSDLYASDENYFADLQKISDLVEQQTGVKANVIRFPGGSSNTISKDYSEGIMSRLTKEVLERGYQYFDWNADSTDASGNEVPVEQLVKNATAGVGMDDVCILMHDTDAKNTTVEALPQIIKAYKDAGYVFRGLDIYCPPVHHGVNN